MRVAEGFSLVELLVVVALFCVLGSIAIGVTPGIIQNAKGQSGVGEVASFLQRHRELAISRRRNIEIDFVAPNSLVSTERGVPDALNPAPPSTVLETMYLEGQVEYTRFDGIPDTPDAFGNALEVNLGGADTVMFTSEGSFTDVNGDPINASVFVGIPDRPATANALTIIGPTATVRRWRYDGSRWVQ
jgi:prepilin-type N-terminal cleavage/methylation domain-containing protein